MFYVYKFSVRANLGQRYCCELHICLESPRAIFFSFKTACTEIGGGSGRRLDMTFLDFWSTSSDLYGANEGSKDAEAASASFEPSSAP